MPLSPMSCAPPVTRIPFTVGPRSPSASPRPAPRLHDLLGQIPDERCGARQGVVSSSRSSSRTLAVPVIRIDLGRHQPGRGGQPRSDDKISRPCLNSDARPELNVQERPLQPICSTISGSISRHGDFVTPTAARSSGRIAPPGAPHYSPTIRPCDWMAPRRPATRSSLHTRTSASQDPALHDELVGYLAQGDVAKGRQCCPLAGERQLKAHGIISGLVEEELLFDLGAALIHVADLFASRLSAPPADRGRSSPPAPKPGSTHSGQC